MDVRENRTLERLVAFAKGSPWLVIAIGLHVIVALAMSVAYIRHERRASAPPPTSIAVAAARALEPAPLPEPEPFVRTKIPEAEVLRELVSVPEDEAFVPLEEPPEELDLSEPVGNPSGVEDGDERAPSNTSIGVGPGNGWRGASGPSPWGGRRGDGDGLRTIGRPPIGGETERTQVAVLEGLRWLARHQDEDGAWRAAGIASHCTPGSPCIPPEAALDDSFDVGMTALALLAFLGQGIGTGSRMVIADPVEGRAHRGGDVVKRGIQWLLERQRPDGSFDDSAFALPENHTLPAMALCEASALAPRHLALRRRAQSALDFLVAAQKRAPDGSPSGYGVGSQTELDARLARGEIDAAAHAAASAELDLSITCWVVMALKSAQSCGFEVPEQALAGALAWGEAAGDEAAGEPLALDEDAFTRHAARRSALGMLVRIFAGGSADDPYLERAAREIAADVPHVSKDGLSVDFYYWYFATLALNQYDGPDSPRAARGRQGKAYWAPWNDGLVESLPPLQVRPSKTDTCARGGWLQAARGNRRGLALYNTALNVLTLEVYYRFDNVLGAAARERSAPPARPR